FEDDLADARLTQEVDACHEVDVTGLGAKVEVAAALPELDPGRFARGPDGGVEERAKLRYGVPLVLALGGVAVVGSGHDVTVAARSSPLRSGEGCLEEAWFCATSCSAADSCFVAVSSRRAASSFGGAQAVPVVGSRIRRAWRSYVRYSYAQLNSAEKRLRNPGR